MVFLLLLEVGIPTVYLNNIADAKIFRKAEMDIVAEHGTQTISKPKITIPPVRHIFNSPVLAFSLS